LLAALLATQPMLGFSLWCAVLLLHWSAKQAGPPAERSKAGGYPLLTAKYELDITLGSVLQAKL